VGEVVGGGADYFWGDSPDGPVHGGNINIGGALVVPDGALLPVEVHVEKTDTEVFTLFNLAYSYDLDSNRTLLTYPAVGSVTYAFGPAGRLSTVGTATR
jgi:hypothetical protein